jgi:hypothetical protein
MREIGKKRLAYQKFDKNFLKQPLTRIWTADPHNWEKSGPNNQELGIGFKERFSRHTVTARTMYELAKGCVRGGLASWSFATNKGNSTIPDSGGRVTTQDQRGDLNALCQ